MDSRFHPAMTLIRSGDVEHFKSLLAAEPALATARSSVSHPTLLQFLVLDAVGSAHSRAMAAALIEHGAEINEPFIAGAGIDNADMADFLLDAGAAIDGNGRWSAIEEALYWGSAGTLPVLLARGASVRNLRIAAGLGRMDDIKRFFAPDGSLEPQAGTVEGPWDNMRMNPRAREPQAIIDNAFVYACMHNHIDAAKYLLQRGAAINAIPLGFDYAGSGLHYAAFRGHREMVEFLLDEGADPTLRDTKVDSTPAGWADYNGHAELKELLERAERQR